MKHKHWLKEHARELLFDFVVGFFVVGLLTTGGVFIWVSTLDIPDLSTFEERRILQSTKIYDRTGEILLYDLHQDVKRTIVPYESISRHIKNATIAIEDDTFFEHWGVRPLAILRAALANMRGGDLFGGQGGSTITQQVIKNSILVREKTLTRKIKEAILALRLEQVLTKDEILGHYLNESPYGGTIYGVEEASLSFFGKKSSDVTLAEAAYLAALPQAPTRYSPYGNNRELLEERHSLVLIKMKEHGFISENEYDEAVATEVEFLPQAATGIRAPHFVMYVREQLARKYGEESLSERGFRVITTLDYELQAAAEIIVKEKVLYNKETFDAENGSLVAMDPKTGEILVMVGSRDYFDEEIEGNFNIALAERQPGSSFKPFVYATAINQLRMSPCDKLPNTPYTIPQGKYGIPEDWSPKNSNDEYGGMLTLKDALAGSVNTMSARLIDKVAPVNVVRLAEAAGIKTKIQANPSIALGAVDLSLLEMVSAYSTFANKGLRVSPMIITRIEDKNGTVLKDFIPEMQEVLSEESAYVILDLLKGVTESGSGIRLRSNWTSGGKVVTGFPYKFENPIAGKTGTTQNQSDGWFMGIVPNLATGVWTGGEDRATHFAGITKGQGATMSLPSWALFMKKCYADKTLNISKEDFEKPENLSINIKCEEKPEEDKNEIPDEDTNF